MCLCVCTIKCRKASESSNYSDNYGGNNTPGDPTNQQQLNIQPLVGSYQQQMQHNSIRDLDYAKPPPTSYYYGSASYQQNSLSASSIHLERSLRPFLHGSRI